MKTAWIVVAVLAGLIFGFHLSQQNPSINITGQITPQNSGFLGLETKHRVQINFNGIESLSGYLSPNNEANLIGSYKGEPANAQCAGAEKVTCKITYKNNITTVTFN
jgi:hypothetical protein